MTGAFSFLVLFFTLRHSAKQAERAEELAGAIDERLGDILTCAMTLYRQLSHPFDREAQAHILANLNQVRVRLVNAFD